MLPTPLSSFWFSNALLIGVLRPRNSSTNRAACDSSGSSPGAVKPPDESEVLLTTASRPKRRGSTNLTSLPDASLTMAWVCRAISTPGRVTCNLPVMPRWTIHCPCLGRPRRLALVLSKSKTMCLPIRRTCTMRECSRTPAISSGEDLSGSGFSPSHTDWTVSPATRLCRPQAMVSTSGNSGMRKQFTAKSRRSTAGRRTLHQPCQPCKI